MTALHRFSHLHSTRCSQTQAQPPILSRTILREAKSRKTITYYLPVTLRSPTVPQFLLDFEVVPLSQCFISIAASMIPSINIDWYCPSFSLVASTSILLILLRPPLPKPNFLRHPKLQHLIIVPSIPSLR